MAATRVVAFFLVLAGSMAACSPAADVTPLPTPVLFDPPRVCVGKSILDLRLRADADDPHLVWFERAESGERLDVQWPVGYGVRFEPDTVVVGEDGAVVMRAGELIRSVEACFTEDRSTVVFSGISAQ